MRKKEDKKIEESSGNVFIDIGVKNPEEALAKAQIAARIYQLITERRLTQKAAAKLLAIDQPRVSDLLRGRLRRFSTEKLIQFLLALGQNVEILITPHKGTKKQPSIKVSSPKAKSEAPRN